MIRLDISSPTTTMGTLRRALSESTDRTEIVSDGVLIGVLVSPERLRQLEALEWLASDPRRMARMLEAREAAKHERLESHSLWEIR